MLRMAFLDTDFSDYSPKYRSSPSKEQLRAPRLDCGTPAVASKGTAVDSCRDSHALALGLQLGSGVMEWYC